ncbi:ribosomal protein L7/L12 [Bermanella marisrubri]|uniref:Ribosomal protein L7/L12 C-terminal domain-containing protein n=1 Tax=Bermanella marisrubri TaxID=207949 RepID=Q1N2B3_9GAMM|nr:ribosomal protein L7/L12 [Bermanella marisrubri]EAT12251.1 hypothetical protein RED65_15468 [Bermanella marisrubri]
MILNINLRTVAFASVTSMLLTACGGSSDDDTTPTVNLDAYTDLTWTAGSDELVGLTYPQGAENGNLFALKRSEDSSGAQSHTLLRGDSATKELKALTEINLEQDYYRDVLALPITANVNDETVNTAIVATCGYAKQSILEGGSGPNAMGARNIALPAEPQDPQEPAQLELYIPDMDISASIDLTDQGSSSLSLINCHSMGGLTVFDLANKSEGAKTQYVVSLYLHGESTSSRFSTFYVEFLYDYGTNEIDTDELDIYEEDSVLWSSAAVDVLDSGNSKEFYILSTNVEGETGLYDFYDQEPVFGTDGNPFTGSTDEGADILDFINNGNDVFAVSSNPGLVGIDFTGDDYVELSAGDYQYCIDALAINGETAWCHDSTEQGSLIEFTLPEVPQSEAPPVVAAGLSINKSTSYKVSKEEAEQIKAELEGAGAEVEVK